MLNNGFLHKLLYFVRSLVRELWWAKERINSMGWVVLLPVYFSYNLLIPWVNKNIIILDLTEQAGIPMVDPLSQGQL